MKKEQSDRLSEQQIEGQGPISIFHEDAQVHDKEAVSYTHLDVYKRQVLQSREKVLL